MMNALTVLQTNTLAQGGKNAFCAIAQNAFFPFSYTIATNALALETKAFKLPPNTATHVATSDFQTELFSKLLLTGTHLRKRAVAALSYSPRVRYTHKLYTQ